MASPFGLSAEQAAMRDMASSFAREEIAPHALEWDREKHFPIETLRAAASLGMAAMNVREDFGGTGLSRLDSVILFEALATGCPSIAAYLSVHNMCAWMVDAYGSDSHRRSWLPALASMKVLSSYCLSEPGSGSDAAALRTRAERRGEVFIVNGEKQFISGAGAGGKEHLYIVMVRTGDGAHAGVSAILVDGAAQGLRLGALERKMGWNAQPTRAVCFENCRVPVENLLGREGQGFGIAMAALDGGRLNIGACSLGGGRSALDKTLRYLDERRAFGRKLNSFQALQFRIADMATDLEAARALLWRAASALDARAAEARTLCAMAKRVATDAGFSAANEALQLHGGYGYLCDYGIEKIVRDLRVHQILEGANEIMRIIIARETMGLSRKKETGVALREAGE
ncbi:acyl-CoA dehydrogenase family protein [Methylocystis heyeri]|uniref:Acyl-CoA dehydrogenase n=1 Tax=Methylocystis heyeri TaxID=391905 RepID=A0A6B8KJX8_9HYPH|nr:acyl-CoA dehydrogenase family protein [Methylocystis heyeri]QGM47245.1 acyl-CoA dehydrogenase [Methylocystis heyeri]